jgi:hypothetical protein
LKRRPGPYLQIRKRFHRSGGQWSGTVNASNDDGPTPVAAQVTLAQTGDRFRVGDSGRWGSQRFDITPYQLVVHVAGPVGPATVTCQLLDVASRFRTMYR